MPITNNNMSVDAKVRSFVTALITKGTASTHHLGCHSRRVKLKKARIFVTTTLDTEDLGFTIGYTGALTAYLAQAASVSGSATSAAGTVKEIDLAGQIVPANTGLILTNVDVGNGAGVFYVQVDYELVDDNSLSVE